MGLFDWFSPKKPVTKANKGSPAPKRTLDLRDPKEKSTAYKAQYTLTPADEKIARDIVTLLYNKDVMYSSNRTEFDRRRERVRQIGKNLCQNGGRDRMEQIAYRVHAIGSTYDPPVTLRNCEYAWDGICGWMA
jgi:hypothetical protein